MRRKCGPLILASNSSQDRHGLFHRPRHQLRVAKGMIVQEAAALRAADFENRGGVVLCCQDFTLGAANSGHQRQGRKLGLGFRGFPGHGYFYLAHPLQRGADVE